MVPLPAAKVRMVEKNGLTYAGAGVNIDAGNAMVETIKPFVRATRRKGADAELGGFGGIFDLEASGYNHPLLVAATDGVGSKVKIASETGLHSTIGIDLVAMCVNDLIVQGAEPLFFLDYYACQKLDVRAAAEVVKGIAQGCIEAGAALIGGETAEMPGLYAGNDYDLAGFAVGAVEKCKLLPKSNIVPGDRLYGLKSSGVHANGYSLIRQIVASTQLQWDSPAPFQPTSKLGEFLLTPTRIYVKPILTALARTQGIKGLAHITGGGFTENIPRMLPKFCAAELDLNGFAVPDVFVWLAGTGGVSQTEMLRTFNCGIGMVLAAGDEDAPEVEAIFKELGETLIPLGRVIPAASGDRVLFSGQLFP